MSNQERKAIIRKWVDAAWNNGDFSMGADLYPADYVLHYNNMPDTRGTGGLAGFINMYRHAMPDLRMEIEDMAAEGDKVIWRIRTSGTHTGDFVGIPPTGNRVDTPGIVISRFEGDRWVEDWVVNDDMSVFQQLGVIPALTPA
ncbi:MAG TPA: ester cyclase [Chloroflexia bacterium]|nr:ester cyclase [Chloroflexia bacterium]